VRKTDWQAVGEVAGEALAAAGTLVKDVHEGVASRPFRILGPAAEPVRVVHDGASRMIYAGVRGGLRSLARSGAELAAARAPADGAPLSSRPGAALVIGAVNGLYGNHLRARGNQLALGMEIRHRGAEVPVTPDGLSLAFPGATGRVVVFAHGLCETEAAWRLPARGTDRADRRTYGERLQQELAFTPVCLRYNTGLHISENGQELARVLDDLVSAWPVEIDELVLVGHSMGGLVARSACHYAEREGRAWAEALRHVFCLGTPHLGADLEKGANALGWALARLPETRALARVLNARSVGIKDLRYGSCVDEDWSDCDPDEFLRDRCQEVPFLPAANYYFIGATLSPDPLGRVFGDLLVRSPSSSGRGNGRGRRIPFEVANGYELTGLTHLDLLNHPAVYAQLRKWLIRSRERSTEAEAA
jgi:pimeloyl-ACP methyl ester carboxylesterase